MGGGGESEIDVGRASESSGESERVGGRARVGGIAKRPRLSTGIVRVTRFAHLLIDPGVLVGLDLAVDFGLSVLEPLLVRHAVEKLLQVLAVVEHLLAPDAVRVDFRLLRKFLLDLVLDRLLLVRGLLGALLRLKELLLVLLDVLVEVLLVLLQQQLALQQSLLLVGADLLQLLDLSRRKKGTSVSKQKSCKQRRLDPHLKQNSSD